MIGIHIRGKVLKFSYSAEFPFCIKMGLGLEHLATKIRESSSEGEKDVSIRSKARFSRNFLGD